MLLFKVFKSFLKNTNAIYDHRTKSKDENNNQIAILKNTKLFAYILNDKTKGSILKRKQFFFEIIKADMKSVNKEKLVQLIRLLQIIISKIKIFILNEIKIINEKAKIRLKMQKCSSISEFIQIFDNCKKKALHYLFFKLRNRMITIEKKKISLNILLRFFQKKKKLDFQFLKINAVFFDYLNHETDFDSLKNGLEKIQEKFVRIEFKYRQKQAPHYDLSIFVKLDSKIKKSKIDFMRCLKNFLNLTYQSVRSDCIQPGLIKKVNNNSKITPKITYDLNNSNLITRMNNNDFSSNSIIESTHNYTEYNDSLLSAINFLKNLN